MKSKEILLWVVAIGALVLSLVAVIGPQGLKSDAARMQYTVQQAQPTSALSDRTAKACHKEAQKEFEECLGKTDDLDSEVIKCAESYIREVYSCNRLFIPVQPNQ